MADKKISELTNITGANLADGDELVVVDTSASETKAITFGEFKTALDTSTGFVRITGDTMTGNLNFGDNDKAIFGAGSDLTISHDTTGTVGSYITEAGTGSLNIRGQNIIFANADGSEEYGKFFNGAGVEFNYADATKFATTSTGVDITGGLTVDGNAKLSAGSPTLRFTETDQTDLHTRMTAGGGSIYIQTENDAETVRKDRFRINHSTGDISFYEDTGTTAKFFWDASAESLGIGTTSPVAPIDVAVNSAVYAGRFIQSNTANGDGVLVQIGSTASSDYALTVRSDAGNTAVLSAKADGNVGIGTFSPSALLHLESAGPSIKLVDNDNNPDYEIKNGNGSFRIIDTTAGSDRINIDSSGNLLVGKTSTAFGTAGTVIKPTTGVTITRSAADPLALNRLSTDGEILGFYKDGTTVGSIGANGGRIFINGDNGSSGGGLKFTATDARPVDRNGSDWDNAFDLGDSGARFDDVYATNGTIQTSDQNEKQQIASLTDAEQRVAVAAKGLLRKFRWKDAVAEKGDEARTHFGIIAQDLQAAFAAEGLNAGDYAMFIHSTWTDEETGEERSRMGVRYSELLAFIIAAI